MYIQKHDYLSFKEYIDLSKKSDDEDYQNYLEAVDLYEQYSNGLLQEGVLDDLSANIKQKFDFIKGLASSAKVKLEDLIVLFKDSKIYQLFKEFEWSLDHIRKIVKEGFNLYKEMHNIIFKWMEDNKVVKWTDVKVKELQQFLIKHPKLKRIGGVVIAGLLLYALFYGTDVGNPDDDFDLTNIINALKGNYDISDMFGGTNGIKFLVYLLNGIFGAGLAQYGFNNAQKLLVSMVFTLSKMRHTKLQKA